MREGRWKGRKKDERRSKWRPMGREHCGEWIEGGREKEQLSEEQGREDDKR